jgi:hypothetical protein
LLLRNEKCIDGEVKGYTLRMPPRAPELQMTYDENNIPFTAKCSLCDEQMPQRTPRNLNLIDSVEWFAAQFRLHIERSHLLAWTGPSRVQ